MTHGATIRLPLEIHGLTNNDGHFSGALRQGLSTNQRSELTDQSEPKKDNF